MNIATKTLKQQYYHVGNNSGKKRFPINCKSDQALKYKLKVIFLVLQSGVETCWKRLGMTASSRQMCYQNDCCRSDFENKTDNKVVQKIKKTYDAVLCTSTDIVIHARTGGYWQGHGTKYVYFVKGSIVYYKIEKKIRWENLIIFYAMQNPLLSYWEYRAAWNCRKRNKFSGQFVAFETPQITAF